MGFRWTFVARGGVEIRDSSCDLGEEMPVTFIYIHIRSTWRIIPGLGYVVNNHGDRISPKDRVVGPLSKWPNFMAYKWG